MKRLAALLVFMAGTSLSAAAGNITYYVNLTIGAGSVTGNIVTDGTIGLLSKSDFVSWDLVLNDGTDPPLTLTNLNSVVYDNGPISATATQLSYNFTTAEGYSAFYQQGSPYGSGVCWSPAPITCIIPDDTATGVSLIVNNSVANSQRSSVSGTQIIGTTASAPTADSVTPNSGSGVSEKFVFKYSSVKGYGYLSQTHALINGSLNPVNACWVFFNAATNSLLLYNDAGTGAAGQITPGSSATMQNSQCTVNGAESSVSGAGNTLTVTLAVTFAAAFNGEQTLNGLAVDAGAMNSGWQKLGTWKSAALLAGAPTADSVTPNSGGGVSQTFTFKYSSVNGASYLSQAHALINGSVNPANACWVFFNAATNSLFLYDDAGTGAAGQITPGSSATMQNSQCTINGAGSSVTGSVNTLTMTLAVTFAAAFNGEQMLNGLAVDDGGLNSGWRKLGVWKSSAVLAVAPTADSATLNPIGTLTFKYSSVNGFGYLSQVHALINDSGLNAANTCWVFYNAATNSLFLYNDAGTGAAGQITPGSSATMQNSQCTINGLGSSVSGAGNTLTMTLAGDFPPSPAGSDVYGLAVDDSGLNSGWQILK